MTYKMSAGDATKVLKAEGIFPCSECRWAKLPYRLDDFHINAQCHSPKNKTIKVSPVTHTEYPDYKAQFCKDTRSDERFCGPKGVWFEPYTRADTAVEKVSTEARKDGNNAGITKTSS